MEQQIRFCTTADGVTIAYATTGQGPPLVKAAHWFGHLDVEWRNATWRHSLEELSAGFQLIRYDERGSGLSDWHVDDISFEGYLLDLEAVVDAVGVDRFDFIGISRGASAAIAYTVRHPSRVSRLVLLGGITRGLGHRNRTADVEARNALQTLIRLRWDSDMGAYQQLFTSRYMPDATPAQMQDLNLMLRVALNGDNAARILKVNGEIDVQALATQVGVPTLVLHVTGDAAVPFEEGRRLAALVPTAHFVPLEGRNHILLEGQRGWSKAMEEIHRFLSHQGASTPTCAPKLVDIDDDRQQAVTMIEHLDRVQLSGYRVVGRYTRFDEQVRQALKDVHQSVIRGCHGGSRRRENHLLWAPPGTGKTFLVQEMARTIDRISYVELNLARASETEFRTRLSDIGDGEMPTLCLIDEVDSKPEEPWPFEALLPHLDAAVEHGPNLVFILAGSSGSSLEEMRRRIAFRPKGEDLLSRVPSVNQHVIPPLSLGDRLLISLTQFRVAGSELGHEVSAIEKLALLYVALKPELANARQLREFTVRAVDRVPATDDRVRYDHLFNPGDPENKAFWLTTQPGPSDLSNRFVTIED